MGENVIAMLQFPPAGKVEPHVVVFVNSAAFVPVMVIPEMFRTAAPTFVRVIVEGGLEEPTAVDPIVTEVGEKETAGEEPLPTVND
jgi:hypothetical protein